MVYPIKFTVMFTKRRLTKHVYNNLEKGNLDLKFSAFYVPTPVDDFTYEKVNQPDFDVSVTLTSDIAMLFNQQRLDRCSKDLLLNYFNSLSRSSSSLSKLRSKLNDDQLISIVKSRYLQSPSELLAYSERLVHDYGVEFASCSQHTTVTTPSEPSPNPVTD